jgi:mono/diheme cytochrome c family protein
MIPAMALGGLALAVGGVLALSSATSSSLPPSDPTDRALVAQGRPLYAAQCAQCHGVDLRGEDPNWRRRKDNGQLYAPPHDVTGHTWHHTDSVLISVIREGGQAGAPPDVVSGMPAFGEILSDTEIGAVLAFIKSSWPAEARSRQAAITQQAGK